MTYRTDPAGNYRYRLSNIRQPRREEAPTWPRQNVVLALVSARSLRLDLLHWRDGHLLDVDPCGIRGSCPVVADAPTFLDALLVKSSDISTSGMEWIEKMTVAVETDN